ncbi:D-lactate dehydrogenase [Hyphomicrobium nitrativorans NL23]|uniref:D-lactate dehydrogenase (cytochrome) n=1 Tax=Hyphomicrobium nitrativorans NL23 TaxID=1029756 RepID=V5SC85_9HYPH|nr:FAD-linked oxidase C-terminal domain-containing protein [Hyphomicrobium nitrativorans]AHB48097.1 D-lactate dehydrogenase [Hyphomicrobium nitrativorans NL23]
MSQATAIAAALRELERMFGERVATGEAVCRQHAHTLTWLPAQPPDGVVWPETTDEVAAIVTVAGQHGVPLIPFGAGTSLEGHVNAPLGGISVDLSRMARVVCVSPADLDCTVEAGVTRAMLNAHLRDTGLFFPVDPGAADATLGGMAATRASGTTTVRYGTMRDNVISLKAVMADGSVMTTGGRARKSSAGYDLTRLLVGSEGTLGIITELTLKLHALPARVIATAAPFSSIAGACEATIEAGASGIALQRIELLDTAMIRAVNAHAKLELQDTPHLFVEIAGGAASVEETLAAFQEIALSNGALRFDWAEERHAKRRLWQARHDAYPAVGTTWPGKTTVVSDVAVPLSALAQCVTETVADIEASRLTAPIVGHVGDGNFHVIPVFDCADANEVAAVRAFLDRLVRRALSLGGTCTGEHGIGQGKAGYLVEELGEPAMAAMRAIKGALDPRGLLNPGKILTARRR